MVPSRPPLQSFDQNVSLIVSGSHGPTNQQRTKVTAIVAKGTEMFTAALASVDVLFTDDEMASYDVVKIANDQNYTFGEYCGWRTGETVAVYGNFALITFQTDSSVGKRGFFFRFKTVPAAPPKITLPAVVEALPGYRVDIPVTGTLPIYTAVIRNSTVLVNTTYAAAFQFYNESNCTSVAFNKYGYDTREFSVIFKDCRHACSPRFNSGTGNKLFCEKVTATQLKRCLSPLTETFVARNRTARTMYYSIPRGKVTIYLNSLYSYDEAIVVVRGSSEFSCLKPALLSMGFTENQNQSHVVFLPCPLGSFSKSLGSKSWKCVYCSPGGFYSDTLGYVADGCKKCPNGSYVAYDKKPGKSVLDCKTCPEGTETDFFAGHRACPCLEGHYRTHLFKKCFTCGRSGLQCQDEYASLKPGFWWQWRNESHKHRYEYFMKNLARELPALDDFSVQYPYAIPTPYRCQVEESCKGGLDSPCGEGYQGPLCAVCNPGYHKQFHSCEKCPSRAWIAGQLSLIAAIIAILLALLVWRKKNNLSKDRGLSRFDNLLSKLKILIGFYQVTHGLLDVFSFIEWPDSLQVVSKYSGILQMNLLKVAPIHCLNHNLHVDAFEDLFVLLSMNAIVIVGSCVIYGFWYMMISKKQDLEEDEKASKISQGKVLIYRNVFFFLYVTYLSTCSRTASVMPFACQKLCKDKREELCDEYLKVDYSIKCQGANYNHLVIVAYVSAAYIIALPALSLVALWRHWRTIIIKKDRDNGSDPEVVDGLRFLFENYKPRSWYWELVEMSRKFILTCGLILVGQESRSFIGLAWVVAGMYAVLFCWIKPMQDTFENRLMSTSLAVTIVNLGIGAVSRIPAENILNMADHHKDALAMKILIIWANTLVLGLLAVQYLAFLHQFFKEWRKNPKWSFSCCLALLLPLNDLQGEIRGMVGKNMLKTQLQSGIIGKPSIAASAKDSGALSFSPIHEDGERQEGTSVKSRVTRCSNTKCDRGTQTETLAPVSTATAEHAQASWKACQQITMSRHSDHHIPLAEAEEATSKEEKTDRNNEE
ncbi:uncharacterized protein [Pocillopora verrucosa]|uniref:uncharacterized protein n=1 Tax=Pocillopora verrucosa TaxID=203993 RepID=UPI00334216C8